MVTCNVIETITATSAVIQQTLSTVKIFQVRKLAITILWRSKKFVILSTYLIWNFHAVITDEVVDQGTLFDCRGRLWDKTRSHQEFFYTPHVWSWLFRFFWSSCIALTTILTIMPNTVREVNTMGFKVMPPATAEVITALPVTTLQIRFFSLVQVALLFIAVMVFAVIGLEIFQHITCPFGQGCVDVVEVKNIFLGVNHWHYTKKNTEKLNFKHNQQISAGCQDPEDRVFISKRYSYCK